MKIISLVFKLDNSNKNPSIFERIDIIDECLSKNPDTDILVCSEAFLARIDNDSKKFTAIDELNYSLDDMLKYPGEYTNIDYIKSCEQNKIIKINDCETEKTLINILKCISLKFPNTLIVPGSVFIRSVNITNKIYIIKDGKVSKEHEKIKTFAGFENIFKLSAVDNFKNFDDPQYQDFLNIMNEVERTRGKKYSKYIYNPKYEVAISICADVSPVEERNEAKLSIYLAPSYGLPPPIVEKTINEITKNVDIYIQPDGLNFETHVVKNPDFKGTFVCTKNELDKFENTIKCFTINVESEPYRVKYLKYKAKYIKLKTGNK
jgi:hypothetical protein